MDQSKLIDRIRGFKLATNIMDAFGAVLAGLIFLAAAAAFVFASMRLGATGDSVFNHAFDELLGALPILGEVVTYNGSVLEVIFAGLLMGGMNIIWAAFLVPTIHGAVTLKRTNKYLSLGVAAFRKAALRDSIIKMLCNGALALWLIRELLSYWTMIESMVLCYLLVIIALEIAVLSTLRQIR